MEREEKQDEETVHEVGEASGKEQQEPMAEREDFSDNDNSENVHTNEGEEYSFEFYVGWPQLEKLLTYHLSFRSEEQRDSAGEQAPPEREAADVSILVPGCGRSKLSENMYDAGFKNITNLDLLEDVISDKLKRNERVRPEMKWRVMDITKMQFANATFDSIVDKGGLDSLMKPPLGSSLGCLYLSEVKRVLKPGGKYVCITLADRHVLEFLFPMFRFGWKISLYAISQEASSREPKLQTFMVVAGKMSSPAVYDISSFVEQSFFESYSSQARHLSEAFLRENMIRLEYVDGNDVIYSFKDLLLGAVGNISKLVPGRRLNLSFGRPEGFINNGVLLDAKDGPFIVPYAVFLVPQNRGHECLFTCEKGQWLNVKKSRASRLLMIFQDSSISDLSMGDIQMDLSPFVKHLVPEVCHEGYPIPYLEEPDLIQQKEIVYKGSSVLTGPIIVEDMINKYKDDQDVYTGCTFRRLSFKSTEYMVQSQALLSIKESNRISTDAGKDKEQQASKSKNKGKQRKSDSQSSRSPVSSGEVKVVHNFLSPYHAGIVFVIRLFSSDWKLSTSDRKLVNAVVIGLGGGLFPMYMKNYFPSFNIEVVELDRKVLQVAREYFGFREDENLKVHITDGIKFVKEKADENSSCKIDILIVDVDTSDPSFALISPAASFLDPSFLLAVKNSLSEQGLFIFYLVSMSSRVSKAIYSRVKKVFSWVVSFPLAQDFDEVLFARKTTGSTIKEDQLSVACKEFAESLEHEKKWIENEVDLSKSIKLL